MTVEAEIGTAAAALQKLDFHHPYTPYDVQDQFMRAVYDVLETGDGQVGILESPTGTGKSLSLICASLTWLRQHKSTAFEASLKTAGEAYKDEPQWLVDQLLSRKRQELVQRFEDREKRLEAIRLKEKALEERGRKRRRIEDHIAAGGDRSVEDEDAEWLLDDWEGRDGEERTPGDALSGLSKESREVLARMGLGGPSKRDDEDDDVVEEKIKIYYTSRTHSQLTQFIEELRRPTFPSSLPQSLSKDEDASMETVKLLPLSSRQKLCVNPSVARLGSVQAINDRCAELQQPKSGKKCQYVPKEDLLSQTHQFRDTALATIPDIEDLHRLGKSLAVCPYYASRTALPGAEIITLPYPLLLQRSAREALGIKLEGSVVIIDEAHNIMDAVASVHAAEIRLSDLKRAKGMLGVYVKRFGKKLKGQNRVNVGRVGRVIEGLTEWMDGAVKFKQEHGLVDANDLMRRKGIDQINLYELIYYVQESKLAFKIESYASHVEETNRAQSHPRGASTTTSSPSSSPVLHSLVSFLVALTNLSTEGRIFYQKLPGTNTDTSHASSQPDVQLSYLLLSPTHAFSSIASAARAVVLAGGTMSPFEDYKDHLFPSLPGGKVTTLSCGHVIPPENLRVWTLASARPDAPAFEFSYQRRGDKEMITQLGLVLLNVCGIVPDGVVVFFPSYGYLDEVVTVWQQKSSSSSSGGGGGASSQSQQPSIWDRLQGRKALFRETRGGASEQILQEYSQAILGEGSKGALLLSVVGGKMSEGINFSDRLGRCVMVIGLPYPNVASPEWKAKMEYIETTTTARLLAGEEEEDGDREKLHPAESSGSTGLSASSGAGHGGFHHEDQQSQLHGHQSHQVSQNTNNSTTTLSINQRNTPHESSTSAAHHLPNPNPNPTATSKPNPTITREAALARGKQAARDFYENACMRAVNQSIGRAIRHRGDYAAIVLVDRRYGTERIRGKLPGWIRGGLVADSHEKGLGQLMGTLGGFFRGKKG